MRRITIYLALGLCVGTMAWAARDESGAMKKNLCTSTPVTAVSGPLVTRTPIVREARQPVWRLKVKPRRALRPASFSTPDGMRGWCVQLPGNKPLATPAVADGKVFCGGGFGSYEFYALDSRSGKLVWELKTTDDGPTAAVVSDGVALYNTESCTIEAVDAKTGKRLWHHWLGDPLMSQPTAAQGRVFIVYPTEGGSHRLICMQIKDGRTIWQQPVKGDAISAPVIEGDEVLLATLDGTLACFDAANGKLRWQKATNATAAPWVEGEEIFTSTRETNVGGVPVAPGTKIEEARQKLPKYPGQNNAFAPVEHYENFVRLNRSGEEVHKAPFGRAAMYLSSEQNARTAAGAKARAHDAGVGFGGGAPEGAKINQAQTNLGANTVSEVWAYQGTRPVVQGNRAYCAQNEVLQCLDARSGKAIWQLYLPRDENAPRTLTPPSLAGEHLFAGTSRGEVICVRARDGVLLWRVDAGAPVVFQPAVMNGRVYFGTENGRLFCLDTNIKTASGWPMWGGDATHTQAAR